MLWSVVPDATYLKLLFMYRLHRKAALLKCLHSRPS